MADAACPRGSPGGETAFWSKTFLVVVTGASGGIGRGIAVSFAEHVAEGSLLVITGRNTAGLEETKQIIAALGREVNVSVETCDHSRALFRDYQDLLERASARLPDPDRVVLVHNAATIGNCSDYAVSYDDEGAIGDYYRLNLTSVMTLTAAFLRRYDSDSGPTRTIVNVSSITGIKAVPRLGLNCTVKVPCAYIAIDEDTWCSLLEEDWQIQYDDRLIEGAVAVGDDWQILFGDAQRHVQSGDNRRRRFGYVRKSVPFSDRAERSSCSEGLKVPCAYIAIDEDTWCPLLEEDWQIQYDDRLIEGAVAVGDDWQILFGDAQRHVQSGDNRRRRFGYVRKSVPFSDRAERSSCSEGRKNLREQQ
ncbi:sepiapterin reductase-like [Ixodes scapularis]